MRCEGATVGWSEKHMHDIYTTSAYTTTQHFAVGKSPSFVFSLMKALSTLYLETLSRMLIGS